MHYLSSVSSCILQVQLPVLLMTCDVSAVWFEPTSVAKAVKASDTRIASKLTYISPNIDELIAIVTTINSSIDVTHRGMYTHTLHVKH
jgi:hypothetical protein